MRTLNESHFKMSDIHTKIFHYTPRERRYQTSSSVGEITLCRRGVKRYFDVPCSDIKVQFRFTDPKSTKRGWKKFIYKGTDQEYGMWLPNSKKHSMVHWNVRYFLVNKFNIKSGTPIWVRMAACHV